jgi:hypothetical protein
MGSRRRGNVNQAEATLWYGVQRAHHDPSSAGANGIAAVGDLAGKTEDGPGVAVQHITGRGDPQSSLRLAAQRQVSSLCDRVGCA